MPFFKQLNIRYSETVCKRQPSNLFCQNKLCQLRKATSLKNQLQPNQTNTSRKRASSSISSSYRASITVEASITLPLFLFFLTNLCSLILFLHVYTSVDNMLYKAAKEMAILAYPYEKNIDISSISSFVGESAILLATQTKLNQTIQANGVLDSSISMIGSSLFEDDQISLVATYRVKPFIGVLSNIPITVTNHCNVRSFTGYEIKPEQTGDANQTYVHITDTGSVYHLDRHCTYLSITTQTISQGQISTSRNDSGGTYSECEICGGNNAIQYYITDYGSRYHTSKQCSALYRNVTTIPISEVGSRRACSKCGT